MCVLKKSTLSTLIQFFHIILDIILEFILRWILGTERHVPAPPNKEQEEVLSTSAVKLAGLIRERKLQCYELVKAYYDRLLVVNRDLNAVVDGPFIEALDEAKLIDERFKNGDISDEELKRKPFLGVPFTTKDSTEVQGKLHTLGLVSRRNERGANDAECVRLMKESGAIFLATSNVPEVNKWIETRNMLIGQTKNPYDYRRSVGGSSGGEAALISACCTAFGLGTDIGGSIRIPAFNCGIFGHKPTKGVVNMRGCTFRSGDEVNTMVAAGPMARYADDLIQLMKVLAEAKISKKLLLEESVNLKSLKYFYIPCNNMIQCNPIGKDEQKLMIKICEHFTNLSGSNVKLTTLPHLDMTGKMWRYWMTQEPANFNKLLGNGEELNPFFELFKKLFGRSDFTMAAIYSLIDALLPPEKEHKIQEATRKCKEALNDLLRENGVLFFHSSPRTAPFHYYPLIKFTDFSYFSIFNVLHVPVTQVPMGIDSRGMPMGIQVVASEMNDRLCLQVAKELERKFGGWVKPYNQK